MDLTQITAKLERWVDDDGTVRSTDLSKASWRPAEVISLTPPKVNILGEGETNIRFRATSLSGVQIGDIVMMQQVGPVWIAVYEVEAI